MTLLPEPAPRRAVPQDAARLQRLAERAYSPWIKVIGAIPLPMTADYGAFVAEHEVWVSGPEDDLSGSLVLMREPDHLLLWSIAVDPSSKGAGLGNFLLNFTMRRAEEMHLLEVRLFYQRADGHQPRLVRPSRLLRNRPEADR